MRTHTPNRFISILTTASALGGTLLFSSVALAGNYEVCVDIQVKNDDSGMQAPTGITEDYWLTNPMATFPARGFYVHVISGNSPLASGYTDSDTGCLAWTTPGDGIYVTEIQVQSRARHGTSFVRVHDGGSLTTSSTPGSLLSPVVFAETIWPDVTKNVTIPLDGDWNVLATASYALWRVRTGLDNTTINIGFDDAVSSGSYGSSSSYVDEGYYLLRINNNPGGGAGNKDARWLKFEVAHEMGHAAARLNYGQDGLENAYDDTYDYNGAFAGCDGAFNSYNLSTAEFDSIGFKEAFAHLYAARVFNDKVSDAALTILNKTISMESYTGATPVPSGGHYRNDCDAQGVHGISTCEDWARFLWDIYTIPTSTCSPTTIGLNDMYDIYSATRAMNPTAVAAWHTDIMDAVEANGSMSTCEKTAAGSFANWNAIGGLSHIY